MATKVTDIICPSTDNNVIYSTSGIRAELSQQSSVASPITATEEMTNEEIKVNFPTGHNLNLGYVPLKLTIVGENIPSVEEIQQCRHNCTTPEVQITSVKEGSIIIGLDVSFSAFINVGHFIEIIDNLLSNLLQRHFKNEIKGSSYLLVSLDFLDKNNEPLAFYKPELQFTEDKRSCLGKEKATPRRREENTTCQSNQKTTVLTMATQVTDIICPSTDTSVLYSISGIWAELSQQSSVESPITATEEMTNQEIKVNFPTGHNLNLDYETDEDSRCRSGICFKELSSPDAIQRHNLSFCRQPIATSDYDTDEDNHCLRDVCIDELSTLEALQRHKLSFCRQQPPTSDYDTDEDNRYQCDVCFKEFSSLEALKRHKLSLCRQQPPTLDIDTTTVSLSLYRYLCENIVGTEKHVKTIRLMNNIWDNMISSKHLVTIISGSFGEGLLMRGSDLDVITVPKSIEVNAYEKKRLDTNIAYCRMVTDDVKPGFTHLLAENYGRSFSKCYEELNGKHYLSRTLFKHYLLRNQYIIHGPCISDTFGLIDDSMCLHCKTWLPQASQWISRSSNSWPSNDVKQNIIKHGVLLLPVKGSLKEDIEWRISFSVGEKMLISTFTHTQLLCYALLKIVLKDVIAMNAECKDLLCSYYMKTIIFWISEELPQSVWKPDNLIPCFMRCLSRLIYCVEYSACLHYFIPENNMFENRIEGQDREVLLRILSTLHSYDWRCVLFSDQLSEWSEYIVMDHIELHTLHTIEVKKTLDSEHLYWSNYMDFNIETCAYKRHLHKLLFCDKSAEKYLHAYYLSKWCAQYAQSISLTFTTSNKLQYKQYSSCLCTLLQNIHHDAVSGWLMLASLFYKSKQYNKALDIITYSLWKFPVEKLYRFMQMSDSHYRLLKLISFQKKTIVRLWKILLVDDINFHRNSWLIPDELQMEVKSGNYFVSSIVYGYFLTVLCHYHLNNVRQCDDSIQALHLLIREKYLIGKERKNRSQAYNILRIASQLPWNHDAARQAVKKERT